MKSPWERPFKAQFVPVPERCSTREQMLELKGNELAVEIGPGVGFHPLKFARENPDWKIVAIEHTAERFSGFERRYINHGSYKNLLPVHANAISWITHHVKENEASKFFLLYPNPYPKESDEKKRWYCQPFMQQIHRCLKNGGELYLSSNFKWYVERAAEILCSDGHFELIEMKEIDSDPSPWTHFEKKYLERNETCFRCIFKCVK